MIGVVQMKEEDFETEKVNNGGEGLFNNGRKEYVDIEQKSGCLEQLGSGNALALTQDIKPR
jgi:hypothetical protein